MRLAFRPSNSGVTAKWPRAVASEGPHVPRNGESSVMIDVIQHAKLALLMGSLRLDDGARDPFIGEICRGVAPDGS